MSASRIGALIRKELREFRMNPGALTPLGVILFMTTFLPLLLLVIIPGVTNERLSDDEEIRELVEMLAETQPAMAALPVEAAAQAFLLQQFLFFFLVGPTIGAVSLAAYSVVGEKQQKTLEPLLTTPLRTSELLVAKAFASLLPALVVQALGAVIFMTLVAVLGAPGVARPLLTVRTALLLGVVGPLTALTAMQMAIAISSRVSDPRSAQQIAVVVVFPAVALLVGQITGAFIIGTGLLLLAAVLLLIMWLLVARFSVALFDRETILTRWK